MNETIPLAPGDRVELLAGKRIGQRVTVMDIEVDEYDGQNSVTYLDPCPIPDCNCDPYATILRSLVRPAVSA